MFEACLTCPSSCTGRLSTVSAQSYTEPQPTANTPRTARACLSQRYFSSSAILLELCLAGMKFNSPESVFALHRVFLQYRFALSSPWFTQETQLKPKVREARSLHDARSEHWAAALYSSEDGVDELRNPSRAAHWTLKNAHAQSSTALYSSGGAFLKSSMSGSARIPLRVTASWLTQDACAEGFNTFFLNKVANLFNETMFNVMTCSH